jgi:uncharacterized membrane protein YciS (DUF1049 family)
MYLFAIIIIFMVCIVGIIFGAQNSGTVDLHFLGNDYTVSLLSTLVIAFATGAVIAFILAIIDEIKLRIRIGTQQKEIEGLKKELGMLKTTPLEAEQDTTDVPENRELSK